MEVVRGILLMSAGLLVVIFNRYLGQKSVQGQKRAAAQFGYLGTRFDENVIRKGPLVAGMALILFGLLSLLGIFK